MTSTLLRVLAALLALATLPPAARAEEPRPLDVRITVTLDDQAVQEPLRRVDQRLDLHDQRLAQVEREVHELRTRLAKADDTPRDEPASAAVRLPMGINVAPPTYFSPIWVYGDALRQAPWDDKAGNYRVFRDAGKFGIADTVERFYAGLELVGIERNQVKLRNGIEFHIDRGAPERGAHAWLPGADKSKVFHPEYVERLRPFKVLRFMDWMGVNHCGDVTPDDLAKRTQQLDDAITLCNELRADPWFCMPHKADDDYVRAFAQRVSAQLHPDAKIYIEESNETWNSAFGQWRWYDEQAKARGDKNAHDFKAERMKRTFSIWRDVFADRPDRVVRVLAGQSANDWHASQLAQRLGKGGFDAVSCAAYIGLSTKDVPADADADAMIDLLRDKLRKKEISRWRDHAAIADRYGVPLIAYEGGQHLTPNGKDVSWYGAYAQAQRSEAMHELYRELLAAWKDAGGGLFVAYYDIGPITKHGAWGHLERQDQPVQDAPKYRALIEAAQ